jgi:cytoskeletal protein CcmA (bactofilin family)
MPFFFSAFRVPKQVLIKGDVSSRKSCIIKGSIEGDLRSQQTVSVKKGATIKGDLTAKFVRIAGTVNGDVRATKVHVLSGGHVKGKILADILHVDKKGMIEDVESVQTVSITEPMKIDEQKWF